MCVIQQSIQVGEFDLACCTAEELYLAARGERATFYIIIQF